MKKNLKKVVLVLALLLPGVIKAQEFNVTAKADFVSDYSKHSASCVFFSPLFLPTFVASL